jgi:hypothetical protein
MSPGQLFHSQNDASLPHPRHPLLNVYRMQPVASADGDVVNLGSGWNFRSVLRSELLDASGIHLSSVQTGMHQRSFLASVAAPALVTLYVAC